MAVMELLLACAGRWRGSNRLQVGADQPHEDSPSTATVTPMLDGRFVRIDQTWSWQGKPQEGSLLIGADPKTREATIHWVDTWHMGHKAMALQGGVAEDGGVDVRGSYAAPPGPDWGWRIIVRPKLPGGLEIVMFNIDPDGREEFAVRSAYTPA